MSDIPTGIRTFDELTALNPQRKCACGVLTPFFTNAIPECESCYRKRIAAQQSGEDHYFWYHGTTPDNAKLILKDGFRAGTWFALHMEDAVKFGGGHVFLVNVAFDETPMRWQACSINHIDASAIIGYFVVLSGDVDGKEAISNANSQEASQSPDSQSTLSSSAQPTATKWAQDSSNALGRSGEEEAAKEMPRLGSGARVEDGVSPSNTSFVDHTTERDWLLQQPSDGRMLDAKGLYWIPFEDVPAILHAYAAHRDQQRSIREQQ